jgi:hypothetical protein
MGHLLLLTDGELADWVTGARPSKQCGIAVRTCGGIPAIIRLISEVSTQRSWRSDQGMSMTLLDQDEYIYIFRNDYHMRGTA